MKKLRVSFLLFSVCWAAGFGCLPASAALGNVIKLTGSNGKVVLGGEETPYTYVDTQAGCEVVAQNDATSMAPIYLYLNVTDPAFTDGNASVVELSLEFFDESTEEVTFSYDSSDPLYGSFSQPGTWKSGGGFQLMDTGTWKTKTIVLKDARFSNRLNGNDLRFRLVGHHRLRLRNVVMKKLERAPELPPAVRTQQDSPNILMIVFDDLNDYVSAFGDPNAKTPNLDSFAESAMRFNRAYCQYPVCGPSRASFMCDLYPEAAGVLDNNAHVRATRPDAVNMLEYFKKEGY